MVMPASKGKEAVLSEFAILLGRLVIHFFPFSCYFNNIVNCNGFPPSFDRSKPNLLYCYYHDNGQIFFWHFLDFDLPAILSPSISFEYGKYLRNLIINLYPEIINLVNLIINLDPQVYLSKL